MKTLKIYFDVIKKDGLYLFEAVTECGVRHEEARSECSEDNIINFLKSFKQRLDDPKAPAILIADSLSILSTQSMQTRLQKMNITLAAPKHQTRNIIEHLLAKFKQASLPKRPEALYAD